MANINDIVYENWRENGRRAAVAMQKNGYKKPYRLTRSGLEHSPAIKPIAEAAYIEGFNEAWVD